MSEIDDLRASAEAGSVVAQSILGMMLLFGDEKSEPSLTEAFRWLSAAASHRVPRASVWLGRMYEDGLATTRDLQRARELYRFGAEHGEFYGCVFLARTYALASEDQAQALRWYAAALEIVPEWQDEEDNEEFVEAKAYVASHK